MNIKKLKMHGFDKIPYQKACFYCIPVRIGILVWSYLKLFLLYAGSIALFVTIILHFLFVQWPQTDEIVSMIMLTSCFILDMVLTNSLLIGMHSKNIVILGICKYLLLVLNLIYMIVWTCLSFLVLPKVDIDLPTEALVHGLMTIFSILNVYICILIHSEMLMIRGDFGNSNVEFINQMIDSEQADT